MQLDKPKIIKTLISDLQKDNYHSYETIINRNLISLSRCFFDRQLETETGELESISLVELILKLNPVESEGVKEAFHCIHAE